MWRNHHQNSFGFFMILGLLTSAGIACLTLYVLYKIAEMFL